MKTRRYSREIALKYLYLAELSGPLQSPPFQDFLDFLQALPHEEREGLEGIPLDETVLPFAGELIQGCLSHWEECSQKMNTVLQNFRLDRVFPIDRAILRIALFEILERKDIPVKVSINEAIELGKKYSTEKSGSFINGVLDQIKADSRAER
jgi:transcription antitermination factor NusB